MQLRQLQRRPRYRFDGDSDAWMEAAEFLNKRSQESARKRVGTADPHLALRRISKKLDVADALLEFVRRRHATLEQGATIDRRLDSFRTAVKQTNAECVL